MNDKKNEQTKEEEEVFDGTVITSIEKLSVPRDEKAFILFISGPLIGKMYLLEQAETLIGRADDVDISISDSRISRHHLRIKLVKGDAIIEDMGSTNGTFVNGERVQQRVLKNGDKIHISSDTLFKFALGDEAERMFQEEMHQMANYDAVTGILNKHAFVNRLKEEFSYAKRTHLGISLLMIDIDFFKKVNDTHGHMAGDYVLNGVAQRIQKAVRDEDILARYGGEEFVVILRGIDAKGAGPLAERVRSLVASEPFKFENILIPVTISIGIGTQSAEACTTPAELIAKADSCLYISTQNGRNRVTA
ncbi:MAG: GGDEF domain-containing protein [Pseudomonadota bacterium]